MPLTVNETSKRLSSLPTLMHGSFLWWLCSDRYSLPLYSTLWDLGPRQYFRDNSRFNQPRREEATEVTANAFTTRTWCLTFSHHFISPNYHPKSACWSMNSGRGRALATLRSLALPSKAGDVVRQSVRQPVSQSVNEPTSLQMHQSVSQSAR